MNTYTLPLTGLTADQLVYMRTIGVNIRDPRWPSPQTYPQANIHVARLPHLRTDQTAALLVVRDDSDEVVDVMLDAPSRWLPASTIA
jgi:hypothetical protein